MLPAIDPFASILRRTFDANYHPDIFQNNADLKYLDPKLSPLSFYDRHIASHLVLKNIVYLPSLVNLLSKACDHTLKKFIEDGHTFCKTNHAFWLPPRRELFRDAHTTSSYYREFVADIGLAYAYKLALHPERQSWDSPFRFLEEPRGRKYLFKIEAWLTITPNLKGVPELMEGLDEALEKRLENLRHRYPRLATWQMFAMTDTATTMLRSSTRNMSFTWETCRTLGYRTIAAPNFPPDAKNSLISNKTRKPSKPRAGLPIKQGPSVKVSKIVTVPRLPAKTKPYRPEFSHYVQHAWATAAAYDSTFMVFQCGRYERIGFRHRASQTLYLSGIIDPINIKDPAYRKLHIGLHTAIVLDALDRLELSDAESKKGQRRSWEDLEPVEMPRRKPLKERSGDEAITSKLYDEIAERDLALVTLDYGAFLSPAPSSFLRVGPSCVPGHAEPKKFPTQTRYNIHDRISLVLKEPLGHGAVGIVHPAIVTFTLESSEVLKRDMVIKLAFAIEQRKRLYNEYRMYGHLSYEGLEGIVTVHGLFKDPESGALGMLMDDAGRSLRRREIERGGDGRQITASPEEKEAFKRVLKGLHEAGVRHHDIRADNLLVNSRNEVFIVDLDCADHEVTQGKIEEEMECLDDILEGRYRDGGYYS